MSNKKMFMVVVVVVGVTVTVICWRGVVKNE
jgi:hypothetical protein